MEKIEKSRCGKCGSKNYIIENADNPFRAKSECLDCGQRIWW